MTLAKIRKDLEWRKVALGQERDRLRDLQSEVEELADKCAEAYDNLEMAIDALSELV